MFCKVRISRGLFSLLLVAALVVSLFSAIGQQPVYADDDLKTVCIYYSDSNNAKNAYGGEFLLANDDLRIFDENKNPIDISNEGSNPIIDTTGIIGYKHFEFSAAPGLYSFETYKEDGVTLGGKGAFEIEDVSGTQNFYLAPLCVKTTLSTEITDYDVEILDYLQQPLPIGNTGGSYETVKYYNYIAMLTPADKPYSYTVIPKDENGKDSEKYAPVAGTFT
jgi:hypothetical protein